MRFLGYTRIPGLYAEAYAAYIYAISHRIPGLYAEAYAAYIYAISLLGYTRRPTQYIYMPFPLCQGYLPIFHGSPFKAGGHMKLCQLRGALF